MTLYEYASYTNESPLQGQRLSYGNIREVSNHEGYSDKELYLMPDSMTGSDYSGNLINKSNHDVFLKDHEEKEGVHDVYGGYGTFAVAIRKDAYESDEDLRQEIDGLEDYPLLDEEEHSRLEVEASVEAWNNWAESTLSSVDSLP